MTMTVEINRLVDTTALAVGELRRSLLNLHLSPEGQDKARSTIQLIIDFQWVLGEIRDLVEQETE